MLVTSLRLLLILGCILAATPAMATPTITINGTASGGEQFATGGLVTYSVGASAVPGYSNGTVSYTATNATASTGGSVNWTFYFYPTTLQYGDYRFNFIDPFTGLVTDTVRIVLSPNHNPHPNEIGEVIFAGQNLKDQGITPLNTTPDSLDSSNVTGTFPPIAITVYSFDETGRGEPLMNQTNADGVPTVYGPVSVYVGGDLAPTPEPGTLFLFTGGMLGLAAYLKRTRA